MKKIIYLVCMLSALTTVWREGRAQATTGDSDPPARVNKCIELLQRGQPIYYSAGYGGYDAGKLQAKTLADYISYNMEHNPLDFGLLREYMIGLVDGGPTPAATGPPR